MSKYQEQLSRVRELLTGQRYYGSVGGLMYWDYWTALPVQGRPYMQTVGNFIRGRARRELLEDETRRLVEFFREADLSLLEDDYQRGAVRLLTKYYDNAVKVPMELSVEMADFCQESQRFWQECNKNADWKAFRPNVQKMFDLKARVAEAIDPHRPTYDVLVGEVDTGMEMEQLTRLFAQLRDGIVEILPRVRDRYAAVSTAPLEVQPPAEVRRELIRRVAEAVGFDYEKGAAGERMHPVCSTLGPRDARPTTNYSLALFGAVSMMHECGHGMYGYSSNQQAVEWGLWGGLSGGFHESQSRFTENMIGKSRAFWEHMYPVFQEAVPQLRPYDLDQFYDALTCVRPSLRRITADELTYNLHLIIRFELERDYFAGKIGVNDLEELWNQKYQDYLGVRPANAREGVLQDVHWSSGHVGYFQSYTLGDLYAAQLRAKLLEDIPDAYAQIAKGDASPVNGWLTEKVRQYGMAYTPGELILKATGEELNARYCVEYLSEKYSAGNP